jgi:catechol 2,3-dioxygenase-like lactoylglutathione lyase family enzyme
MGAGSAACGTSTAGAAGSIPSSSSQPDPRELAPITVELFVPDVQAGVRFYTEKLGFELVRLERETVGGREMATFAIVGVGNAFMMLAQESLYVPGGEPLATHRGVGIDTRIVVDDVDAMYRRASDNGVTIVHDIGDRPYGLRDFIIRDPDGFRLRFASALA